MQVIFSDHLTGKFRKDVSAVRARFSESKLPDEPHQLREKERMAIERVLAQGL